MRCPSCCLLSMFVCFCSCWGFRPDGPSSGGGGGGRRSGGTAVRDRYRPTAGAEEAAATAGRRQPNEPLEINANLTIEQIAHVLLQNYDNHHRPSLTPGAATIVEINMFVQSFGSISVIDMDYTIDVLLRQRWVDPRLRYRGYEHTLSMSYLKEQIWIPDLFFRNAKYGFLHEITTPNYLIWLQHDGSITFSQKLTVKLSCPMQLWNFPMDTQNCPLEIGSYGFSRADLEFVWMRNSSPVSLNNQMLLNEFELPAVNSGTCQRAYNATGQFTCLFVEFKLERKFGFYLIYTYLPSVLIVTISWISFWIDYKAVPARITLGLLSVLALMTQSAATMQKLPRVSYIKAIDVWLFACLAFVVGSLLEFALVNMMARRIEQKKLRDDLRRMMGREMRRLKGNFVNRTGAAVKQQQQQQQQLLTSDEADQELRQPLQGVSAAAAAAAAASRNSVSRRQSAPQDDSDSDDEGGFKVEKLDSIFVFAYPIFFSAFNLVYWFTYILCKTR